MSGQRSTTATAAAARRMFPLYLLAAFLLVIATHVAAQSTRQPDLEAIDRAWSDLDPDVDVRTPGAAVLPNGGVFLCAIPLLVRQTDTDVPLFDTTSSQGRLLLAVLAAIASFERDLIRERTSEGRKRAMAEGKRSAGSPS